MPLQKILDHFDVYRHSYRNLLIKGEVVPKYKSWTTIKVKENKIERKMGPKKT